MVHTVHLLVETGEIHIKIIQKHFRLKVLRRKWDFVELGRVLTIVWYFIYLPLLDYLCHIHAF